MKKWELAFNVLPPRMVALVSTVDSIGKNNLAPYSEIAKLYSNHFFISIDESHDTYKNIIETGDFVVGLPSIKLAEQIAIASKPFPKGVSEFEKAGFTSSATSLIQKTKNCDSTLLGKRKRTQNS